MPSLKGSSNPSYKHGHSCRGAKSKEYTHFMNVKSRCTVVSNKDYPRYGGVGIGVCDRWLHGEGDLTGFECFRLDMGDRPTGTTLDRIEGSLGYSPDNCRWATNIEQANNKRTSRILEIDGEKKTLAEWSRVSGIGSKTIADRLKYQGMSVRDAVFKPLAWTKK